MSPLGRVGFEEAMRKQQGSYDAATHYDRKGFEEAMEALLDSGEDEPPVRRAASTTTAGDRHAERGRPAGQGRSRATSVELLRPDGAHEPSGTRPGRAMQSGYRRRRRQLVD